MKFPLIALSLVFFVSSLPAVENEVIWSESFQESIGSAQGYYGHEQLDAVQENGESFLRVTLPGKKPLEGVRFNVSEVEGSGLAFVSAKVRGSGSMGPMIQVGEAWTRLPTMTLSDKWQEVRIPRSLKSGQNLPIIYFVSMEKEGAAPGSAFEISDLQVTLAPPLKLPQSEVKSRRFEIEDYVTGNAPVASENGEMSVLTKQSFATEEIPFPQTSQPVNVYIRYRPASLDDHIEMITRHGGAKQLLRTGKPTSEGWQWLELSGLEADEVGESFTIEAWPQAGASQPVALDAFVITTEPHLDETALDAIK